MSNGSNASSAGGIGFIGLLAILFIGLKLTNCISWSWWWVLAPILVVASIIIGCVVYAVLTVVIKHVKQRRKVMKK